MKSITIIILLFAQLTIQAQDSVLLTKEFRFQDGVYISFEELKNNTPSYHFDDFDIKEHPNNQYDSKRLELTNRKTLKRMDTREIFAMCFDGAAFVNYEFVKKPVLTDYGIVVNRLTIVGKLCFFIHQDYRIGVSATGHSHTYTVNKPLILNFERGDIFEFTVPLFLKNIEDDEPLKNALKNLEKKTAAQKLYKCLLIYNDRHNAYVYQ